MPKPDANTKPIVTKRREPRCVVLPSYAERDIRWYVKPPKSKALQDTGKHWCPEANRAGLMTSTMHVPIPGHKEKRLKQCVAALLDIIRPQI